MSPTRSNKKILPKVRVGSPSHDGGSSRGGGSVMKKGPWTSAEDAILVDYVKRHGEGNRNAVQKHSGLLRCGKSCRLRWANHLHPNLRKGAFTPDEEQMIAVMHATMGNKWARMAAQIPGRTDNEIKNYWNTRVKRCQRSGVPVYPPNLSYAASLSNENNQGPSIGGAMQNEVMQDFSIPECLLKDYNFPLEISGSNMMSHQGFVSPTYDFSNQRLQAPEALFPPVFGNLPSHPYERKMDLNLAESYFYNLNSCSNAAPHHQGAIGNNFGSHGLAINGDYFSTSSSLQGTVNEELPSLQFNSNNNNNYNNTTATSPSRWISSPAPEAVADSFIQSPPTVSVQSESTSSRNSGLLEEVLHESHALISSGRKLQFSDKSSNSSSMTAIDIFTEDPAFDDYDRDSPFGFSAASSLYNDWNLHLDGLDNMLLSTEDRDMKPKQDLLRPDALLGSACILNSSEIMGTGLSGLKDAYASILGDALSTEQGSIPSKDNIIGF